MGKRGAKPKYSKSMRGFWHKDPSGEKRWSISGYVFKWVRVPSHTSISDDLPIAVLGVEEEHGGDVDWKNKHWIEFHKYIAKDMYVLLVEGGPLEADIMTKAEAMERFGEKIEAGDKKDRRTSIINGTQFLKPEYWKWNKREMRAVKSKSTRGVLSVIVKRLQRANIKIERAYAIQHCHDKQDVWDFITEEYEKQPKDDHVHFLIKIDKSQARLLDEFADIIGIATEFLLYPERGRYAFENPLSYLIHIKDEDKYLYDPHDVVTLLGDDYLDIYAHKKLTWEKARAIKAKQKTVKHDLDWFLDQIRDGYIKTRDEIFLTDEYKRIYSRHPDACDKAFQYAQSKLMADEVRAFKNHEYVMTVVFVHGKAGLGKTTLCRVFTEMLHRFYGWSVGKTAGRHATETWHGEQVMFMDDADSYAMDATAWKHLLDPYHSTPIDERFHAKGECKPRVIVITSEHDIWTFFSRASMNAGMNISQFIRRCGIAMEVMDWNLWHEYFCAFTKPIRTEPHMIETQCLDKEVDRETGIVTQVKRTYRFDDVTWTMTTPEEMLINGEVPAYSPWAAIDALLRIVDKNQKIGAISGRDNADELYHDAQVFTSESVYPAGLGITSDWTKLPPVIPRSQTEVGKKELALAAAKAAKEAEDLKREQEYLRVRHELDSKQAAAILNEQRERQRIEADAKYQSDVAVYESELASYKDAQNRIKQFDDSSLAFSPGYASEINRLRNLKKPVKPDWHEYATESDVVVVDPYLFDD